MLFAFNVQMFIKFFEWILEWHFWHCYCGSKMSKCRKSFNSVATGERCKRRDYVIPRPTI